MESNHGGNISLAALINHIIDPPAAVNSPPSNATNGAGTERQRPFPDAAAPGPPLANDEAKERETGTPGSTSATPAAPAVSLAWMFSSGSAASVHSFRQGPGATPSAAGETPSTLGQSGSPSAGAGGE